MKRQQIAGLLLAATVLCAWLPVCESAAPAQAASHRKGENYFQFLGGIKKTQQRFYREWQAEAADKDSLLQAVARYLHRMIAHDLFSYWDGTPWNFYGTSDTPQCGSIACGYFVTTLLRDAGLQLDRNGLAKDYSENMIKKLLAGSSISRHVPFDCEQYLASIKRKGDALYIVGLDNHTGFISVEKGEAWFIHSTVLESSSVVREKADESGILLWNRYTVSGCLTCDRELLQRWINSGKNGNG